MGMERRTKQPKRKLEFPVLPDEQSISAATEDYSYGKSAVTRLR